MREAKAGQEVQRQRTTAGRREHPRRMRPETRVLFWANLNPCRESNKAISSEVALFVFWRQKGTDALIDAFWFFWGIEFGLIGARLGVDLGLLMA